jgi:hypothetical protein
MKWHPVEVLPVSALVGSAAAGWVTDPADDEVAHVLRVSFVGEYRTGSAGNPDADYILAFVAAALALDEPGAVVLDLRGLRYRWGNRLLRVFEAIGAAGAEFRVGVAVVCGPESLPAFTGLVGGPQEWLHDTLDGAVEHALTMAFARARAIG